MTHVNGLPIHHPERDSMSVADQRTTLSVRLTDDDQQGNDEKRNLDRAIEEDEERPASDSDR